MVGCVGGAFKKIILVGVKRLLGQGRATDSTWDELVFS